MLLVSTSPAGINPSAMRLRSHSAQYVSISL